MMSLIMLCRVLVGVSCARYLRNAVNLRVRISVMGSISRDAEWESKVRQGDECCVWEPRALAIVDRRVLRGPVGTMEASHP